MESARNRNGVGILTPQTPGREGGADFTTYAHTHTHAHTQIIKQNINKANHITETVVTFHGLTCSLTAVFADTEDTDELELGPSELAACSFGELKERRHLTRFSDMIATMKYC